MNRLEKLKNEMTLKVVPSISGWASYDYEQRRLKFIEGFDVASAEYEKIIAELEGALERIGHDTSVNCDAENAKNECFDVAQVALQKLKEFRGEK